MRRPWSQLMLLYFALVLSQAWICAVGQAIEAARCLAVGRPGDAQLILATYPDWTIAVPVLGGYRYEDAIALCPLPAEARP